MANGFIAMTDPSAEDTDPGAVGSFAQYMENGPPAVAITRGPNHLLVYANLAFRQLTSVAPTDLGHPIADALRGLEASGLGAVLERVFRTTVVARNTLVAGLGDGTPNWRCTVWPQLNDEDRPERLVIEIWESSRAEMTLALQRDVAERMLLSALRERDATDKAEKSGRRATFLAAEGRRLAESLDETRTQAAVAGLALPSLAAWCIVDVFDANGAMHRLRIVHPDPTKQAVLRDLESHWSPEPDDPFGLPAVVRRGEPVLIEADRADTALAAGAHAPETLSFLRTIGIGALLTVPLVIRESLVGAVTFVSEGHVRTFSGDDVALAQGLADRSAMALDSAQLHGQALSLKSLAETANRAKMTFLGTVSHELRTPLNAIGGYVDLILLGVRGPVNEAQQIDLGRIKSNQRHLLGLITDLLNFVRVDTDRVSYDISDVAMHDSVSSALSLVDALIVQRGLVCDVSDDAGIAARADAEKLQQILVNLLSNAIKFTPAGGRISIDCRASETTVHLQVTDTGIGIPADKLEAIFDPFVQVKEGFAGRDSGIGLGLAISRELARAMGGELRVESELERGSRFILELPRASQSAEQG